jgi:hypothetical protein
VPLPLVLFVTEADAEGSRDVVVVSEADVVRLREPVSVPDHVTLLLVSVVGVSVFVGLPVDSSEGECEGVPADCDVEAVCSREGVTLQEMLGLVVLVGVDVAGGDAEVVLLRLDVWVQEWAVWETSAVADELAVRGVESEAERLCSLDTVGPLPLCVLDGVAERVDEAD